MSSSVLDASALIAFLRDEPGGQVVEAAVEGAAVSTLNWSEVCRRLAAHRADTVGLREEVTELGVRLVPFSADDAETAAALWSQTRQAGLSLADRACLALAWRLARPAMTADRSWLGLDLGVEIVPIR